MSPLEIRCGQPEQVPALVLPRFGSQFFAAALRGLQHLEAQGATSYNCSDGIRRARDKWESLQILKSAQIPVPLSLYSFPESDSRSLLNSFKQFPLVLKTIHGNQGRGVVLVESLAGALSAMDALRVSGADFFVQEFIAESRGEDIRCLVLEGEVIACVKRTAPQGDFRSNLHRGGSARFFAPSVQTQDLAVHATQILGLQYAGVDIIESVRGPLILEVNPSPGLEGIEKVTGLNLAHKIVDKLRKKPLNG